MEDLRISYRELGNYIIYLNILMGVLFGSLPLIAGLALGDRKRAWIGFILAVIGGALLGIFLSYPIALVFLLLIVRAQKKLVASAPPAAAPPQETADN